MPEDLQLIRKRKGMEAAQLAARAGIPLSLLKEYEAGSKPISPDHLRRLARALYVEPWDINPRSAPPRREEKPLPPRREEKPAAPPSPKKEKPRREPRPPAPIREGQIAHLLSAAARFGIDRAALEAQIGKPLEQMNEVEGRQWNRRFTERLKAEKPPKKPIDRRRAYLPEGVDRFESDYLEAVKASGDTIAFTLFNGEQHHGAVIGYCPYSITIRQADGSETTLNKLAIAYYRRAGGSA